MSAGNTRSFCAKPWHGAALVVCLGCAGTTHGEARAVSAPATPSASAAESSDSEQASDANASAESTPEAAAEEPEPIEDEGDEAESNEPASDGAARPHPLDGWSEQRIRETLKTNRAALGSMSIGQPNSGALLNGERAASNELFSPVDAAHCFGTEETLRYLTAAVGKVHEQFEDTPALSLGHISAEHGGPLRPHVSHQAGRDVDISFYYVNGAHWYTRATESNLDFPRTWAFIKALVTETDVEMILIDRSIQLWLKRFALEHGEDDAWVESLFEDKHGSRALVRHAPGHTTHIHVRFYNPIAQETARRAYGALVAEGVLPPMTRFITFKARRGDTLGKLSKRYGVSIVAIREANGLHKNRIREQRDYRIPVRVEAPAPARAALRFPPRRLPPAHGSQAQSSNAK